jgi:hypothetical protein
MLIGLGLLLSGIILSLIAVTMLLKRRMLLASLNGTAGIGLICLAAIFVLILLNVHTYNRLTREIELVELEIGARTSQGIPITLQSSADERVFFIDAAEWQLDARFLKWKSWAYLIGSEPLVRLESLSGRNTTATSGMGRIDRHKLVENIPLLTELGSKLSGWFGMVDTYYGSSVYMPAVEGAVYSVSATVSGLVARAENHTAQQAVSQWMLQ